jgi:hypothetical protein
MANRRAVRLSGLLAALSVVLGTLVGAGASLLVGRWNGGLAVGIAVCLLVWAALAAQESRRELKPELDGPPEPGLAEADQPELSPPVNIDQRTDTVTGELTGYSGHAADHEIIIKQDVGLITKDGKVTGYTDHPGQS